VQVPCPHTTHLIWFHHACPSHYAFSLPVCRQPCHSWHPHPWGLAKTHHHLPPSAHDLPDTTAAAVVDIVPATTLPLTPLFLCPSAVPALPPSSAGWTWDTPLHAIFLYLYNSATGGSTHHTCSNAGRLMWTPTPLCPPPHTTTFNARRLTATHLQRPPLCHTTFFAGSHPATPLPTHAPHTPYHRGELVTAGPTTTGCRGYSTRPHPPAVGHRTPRTFLMLDVYALRRAFRDRMSGARHVRAVLPHCRHHATRPRAPVAQDALADGGLLCHHAQPPPRVYQHPDALPTPPYPTYTTHTLPPLARPHPLPRRAVTAGGPTLLLPVPGCVVGYASITTRTLPLPPAMGVQNADYAAAFTFRPCVIRFRRANARSYHGLCLDASAYGLGCDILPTTRRFVRARLTLPTTRA